MWHRKATLAPHLLPLYTPLEITSLLKISTTWQASGPSLQATL